MVVIKVDRAITQFDAESLADMYAKQVERGVVVLGQGDSLVVYEMPLPLLDEGANE